MGESSFAVGVVDPPVDAVVLHGRGPDSLDSYRNATVLGAVLTIAPLPAALRAALAPADLVAQTESVVAWLVDLPLERIRALMEDPSLRVLVADIDDQMINSPNGDELVDLALRLPVVLLAFLAQIDPGRTRWSACLPRTRRAAPLGSPVAVLAASHGGLATIDVGGDEVTIDDGRSCGTFRLEPSGGVEVLDPGGLRVEQRRFVVGGIEVVGVDGFGELARNDVSDGRTLYPETFDLDERMGSGLSFLVSSWPEATADILTCCRAVVPLEAPDGRIYSASSPHVPGVVQLTFHAEHRPAMLAETLVHECAHLKLDGLATLTPLLQGVDEAIYSHPWRPDPRPLRGVLLGAHAFLNVAVLYGRAAEDDPSGTYGAEHDQRMAEVREALSTLGRHAEFTSVGQTLFEGMCALADAAS